MRLNNIVFIAFSIVASVVSVSALPVPVPRNLPSSLTVRSALPSGAQPGSAPGPDLHSRKAPQEAHYKFCTQGQQGCGADQTAMTDTDMTVPGEIPKIVSIALNGVHHQSHPNADQLTWKADNSFAGNVYMLMDDDLLVFFEDGSPLGFDGKGCAKIGMLDSSRKLKVDVFKGEYAQGKKSEKSLQVALSNDEYNSFMLAAPNSIKEEDMDQV
ncbi:hypothetical protein EV361DRAFT_289443 [Lentinula raphanica]|uniref:Uncharacterized protein n=1 Tax=Lentinula raphanica TaxID=153919 RepID=A0AA38P849_9AGAR|nr:hypothetical protein F5878DRAFT_725762 [Lentinula raphanica]KAJ3970384.1 hypothetical protein EV361DRAFT_289443 [Lentinula raphanica]